MPAALRPLTTHERRRLTGIIVTHNENDPVFMRAWILLSVAAGSNAKSIAYHLAINGETVYYWIRRFNRDGLAGLKDRPRGPRLPRGPRGPQATQGDASRQRNAG